MLYVINYADGEPYESYRRLCTKSAYKIGHADRVIEFSKKDIPSSYIKKHENIFLYERGAGLWLWKPYLVNRTLEMVEDSDWILYVDGGSLFIGDIHKLIHSAESNQTDVMLFEQPLLHRQFTKHETMQKMQVEDDGSNQTLGIFMIKKTKESVALMREWLACCENETLISPKHFSEDVDEYVDFVAHREDQSILSALRIKYKMKVFRDPSDYGEMPFQYATNSQFLFNPKLYPNSNYPTLLLCSRKVHPLKYLVMYFIRKTLCLLGVRWTEKYFLNRFQCKKIK